MYNKGPLRACLGKKMHTLSLNAKFIFTVHKVQVRNAQPTYFYLHVPEPRANFFFQIQGIYIIYV
jgi:hypothetical protein